MADKQVMIMALDESDHSFYALDWILTQFFSPPSDSAFKLIIIHAKTSPVSAIGLGGPGSTDVLHLVEADLTKTAEKVISRAKDLCTSRSVTDVQYEVIKGDARNVMCEAVEKFHASVLTLGSHGYGAFKRAVLGSVSDYCCHHARCSVMIVKKPKQIN
ncbi:universal stress protein PHOS34-like isoform X2 [Olea europaea var. sylvestris]|uniref:universal stress protein PHOS34-like isoform X2 n=1 Tax=Olea europaea var. sylvestris TaxID=158386 RepID=UPI000C1D5357|nr:universal stress protein PHOS34-like isoform X2 [Olea europaea var. sylvestris]